MQKSSDCLFWFSIGGHVMDQEVEMVDSLEELKSSRSVCPNYELLYARIASALNKIIQIFTSRRRSVSRNRKPRKRTGFYEKDRSPSWSTTSCGLLALMIQYWITLICSLSLFPTTKFRNSIQDGMKFYSLCQRFHPITSWKVCTNWEHMSLCNSKLY